ncbi:MAG: acyl--CoA ligase [Acidimicrobiia bacterium]|nr:acyl--CoA ligase [Acidimicrobiia bacterium]
MTDTDPVIAELTGPGGAFEIVVEDVCGVPTQVFAQRMRSMRELIVQNALRGDVDWIVQGDVRLTFGDHDAAVRSVATRLAALGVRGGDRVALAAANCPEWVVTFWATAALGAVLVPLNAWWKAEELEFGIIDSGAKVLIGDARRIEVLRPRLTELRELLHVFSIGEAGDHPVRPFDELLGDDSPALPETPIDEDDLLAIAYTSGTTGQPKGATITHRQAIANLQNIILAGYAQALRGNTTAGGVGGPAVGFAPHSPALPRDRVPRHDGRHVRDRRQARPDATGTLRGCTRHGGDRAGEGHQHRRRPHGHVADRRVARARPVRPLVGERASYGGAPAAPELVQRIEEVFPALRKTLSTAYGLTESASVATLNAGDDYFSHPGSVGPAVPTVEIRVVDADGNGVPAGERGEILVKGPTVMARGYWRRPEANAAALTDGWFHSGDIGYLDADGFLYIVDRAKDMIIRAGENIYCVEVEHVLFDHPDVVDAAVVGVEHKELGEEVKAVVQLRDGATATADEIRAFCRLHLADFKVPEYVEMRAEPLPRNPAGKILKSLLRGGETSFAESADDSVL